MTTPQQTDDGLSDLTRLLADERDFADADGRADRRVRRRRLLWVWCAVLVLLALVVGAPATYVTWALGAPVASPVGVTRQPDPVSVPATALTLPAEGAAAISVSGADEFLGGGASGIWATSGTDEPRSMGSISKLITALVVLDARPLADAADPGPTLTFDEADNDLYDKYYVMGATIAAMPTGSSMSQHDALAAMLIPSASNYAEAVSTWAFGSPGAFVAATRRWLSAHGLAGTTMVESTGIDPRNVSTPTDLIAIGKLAAAHPVVASLAATSSLTLPGPGVMYNTNGLLGDAGITGLKTGNLGTDSFNLLYTASLDVGTGTPLSVVGVRLGGFSRESVNDGVLALLSSIRAGFHDVQVAAAGDRVGSYSTPWGSTARLVIASDATILTWSDTPITVSMETTTPVRYEDGETVGTITWTAGPRTVTANLVVAGTIEPPSDWWRLTHPAQLG